jgi:hypothetical protein
MGNTIGSDVPVARITENKSQRTERIQRIEGPRSRKLTPPRIERR